MPRQPALKQQPTRARHESHKGIPVRHGGEDVN
jgi:hypothetical protein